MEKKFLIFSLGQTLIYEWKFIEYFDKKVFEQINGFGARIDFKNYMTLRNNIIQTGRILNGGFEDLVKEICNLTLPVGYEKIVLKRIQSEVLGKSKKYCYVASHVKKIIETLSENHYLGIISCYPKDYSELLRREYIYDLFKLIVSASDLGFNKLDQRLISYFVKMADITPSNCVMIGDRLDTEIYQANKLGMMTIRVTDSIFSLQSPRNPYEVPCYTVENLKDLVIIINNFVN